MHSFNVSRLAIKDGTLVYPLVRELIPGLELEAWLAFVKLIANQRANRTGIMAVTRAGQLFPCGLFCYRCHDDLALGAVLTAEHFVALDILDPAQVIAAMVEALEQLASGMDCKYVRTVARRRDQALANRLRTSGYRTEATNFVKHLAHAAD